MARRKRRADPYADQSSAPEDDAVNSHISELEIQWLDLQS